MKVLLSREEIDQITSRMADEITRDYNGQKLIVIGVLTGSVFFLADLLRKIPAFLELELDFVGVSSYQGTTSTGNLSLTKDIQIDIRGQDVLIVEDIFDTGRTLSLVRELLLKRSPKSLKIAVFLDKPSRREVKLEVDYIGRVIPNVFVVGYGLDYEGRFRNLRDVNVMSDTDIVLEDGLAH